MDPCTGTGGHYSRAIHYSNAGKKGELVRPKNNLHLSLKTNKLHDQIHRQDARLETTKARLQKKLEERRQQTLSPLTENADVPKKFLRSISMTV